MNYLRGFILIGSLGTIWSKTMRVRNLYKTLSVLAYFGLMSQQERNRNSYVTIRPQPTTFGRQPVNVNDIEINESNPIRKKLMFKPIILKR